MAGSEDWTTDLERFQNLVLSETGKPVRMYPAFGLRQVTIQKPAKHSVRQIMQRVRSLFLAESDVLFGAVLPTLLIHIEQSVEIRLIFTDQLTGGIYTRPSTVLEPQFDNVIHVDFSTGQRL